jgi:hypothetical protein
MGLLLTIMRYFVSLGGASKAVTLVELRKGLEGVLKRPLNEREQAGLRKNINAALLEELITFSIDATEDIQPTDDSWDTLYNIQVTDAGKTFVEETE